MLNKETVNPSFKIPFLAQLNLLNTINAQIQEKLDEIYLDTPSRFRRGLVNGIGTVWKVITGSLDASDGEFYNECINKIEKDDKELQFLMKNQIQIVSSTIKNFNNTLRKLNLDETVFNANLVEIQQELAKNQETKYFFELQIKALNMIEQIMQTNSIILDELGNIIDSITFARLKILHPSVIKPEILLKELEKIPLKILHGNLPFDPNHDNLSKLIALIKIEAFQTKERIIFILHIPIVSYDEYDHYHVFAAPTRDPRTNLFHVLIPQYKYVAISKDRKQYFAVKEKECLELKENSNYLCHDIIPKPVASNSPCEIIILIESKINENCNKVIAAIDDYNVQKLNNNKWLLTLSHQLPVTTLCPGLNSQNEIINGNSILTLNPKCSAFIGITRVYASTDDNDTVTSDLIIPNIEYDCCEHLPAKEQLPKLTPIKINNLNLDELNVADEKLKEYDRNLDKIISEPFATRHYSTFTYVILTLVIILIFWFLLKCCMRRKLWGYFNGPSTSDHGPDSGPCCTRIYNYCNMGTNRSETPTIMTAVRYDAEEDTISYQRPGVPILSARIANKRL